MNARVKIELNTRFLRLVVVKEEEVVNNERFFLCKCDCGNFTTVRFHALRCGQTGSCGCLLKGPQSTGYKHGGSKLRLYRIWSKMRSRCYHENDISYERYGARGIRVCEDWQSNYASFEKWSLGNGYSPELTLDRVENNGNYEPSNCRWASRTIQNRNKSNNVIKEFNGKSQNLSLWAEEFGMRYDLLQTRIARGWTIERALLTPAGKRAQSTSK